MANRLINPTERDIARFFSKLPIDRSIEDDECWPWQEACFTTGYGAFWLAGTCVTAHRVAWVIGNNKPIPEGEVIRHSCDNRPCCRLSHLSNGTFKDNSQDLARGRKYLQWDTHKVGIEYKPEPRGENKGINILSVEQVLDIRRKLKLFEVTQKKLAEDYGVSNQTISNIACRVTWNFLGDDGEELYPPKPGRVGSAHHKAKLVDEQVLDIRKKFSDDGRTYQELAKEYGVDAKNIGQIIRRRTWRHI